MTAPRDRRHIVVPWEPRAERYTPHPPSIRPTVVQPPDRVTHGKALKAHLLAAAKQAEVRRPTEAAIPGAQPGLYIQLESRPGVPLQLQSLEDARKGIELVSVTRESKEEEGSPVIERATVFVPDGKLQHLVDRFEKYAGEKQSRQRHHAMIDPIQTLRLATLRALWTDDAESFPEEKEAIWWEVWLRRQERDGTNLGGEAGDAEPLEVAELQRLRSYASQQKMEVGSRVLVFEARTVALVRGNALQLSGSMDVLGDLAEVRRAKETAGFFVELANREQAEWAKDLQERSEFASEDAPAVCVLDTGVNRGHPLLQDSLAPEDCLACDPMWMADDHDGHGTQMAGLALFGDLAPALEGAGRVALRHRLESVKILPPQGKNPPELYGTLTAEAAGRVEVQAPRRRRCFSMAVTTNDNRDRGQPSSWSAAVDALAAGVYEGSGARRERRLFVISAGNMVNPEPDHLARCDTEPVLDPAQAWNGLTVGACTSKTVLEGAIYEGWAPVSSSGDLSPWSTTSVTFAPAWPIKPDVVFEGGNAITNRNGEVLSCDALSLLTTNWKPAERHYDVSSGTSPAAAQVARMAAMLSAEYPDLWPEAIRALLVHSAEWTPAMNVHCGVRRMP